MNSSSHTAARATSAPSTPPTPTPSGALAVEISVRTTRDGKFVCMHDASIKRTTGANLVVRDTNLDELRRHRVDMRENLGDNIGLYDIPTLEEAIEAINNVPEGGE